MSPSGKISSTYSSLVNSILAEAQALYKLGFPDQGTTLLGAIVPSAFPVPPSSSLQTYLSGRVRRRGRRCDVFWRS